MASDRAPSGLFGVVVRPLQAFFRLEAASAVLLLLCAVAALAWANLGAESYRAVFEFPLALGAGGSVATFTFRELVNDGLMAVFFLVVGMEIHRELVSGELDSPAKAALPAVAALGGMIVPSAIYFAFNPSGPGAAGWGIPMATDIAFCIGVLGLLSSRVPRALLVFVTALAIFDDIGGILVIAIFYGHGIHLGWLAAAAAVVVLLVAMNRGGVVNGLAYAAAGLALWYALHHGGIHATIAGVVLGTAIPARPRRPSREVLGELAVHVGALDGKPRDAELEGAEILAIEEKLEDLQAPLARFVHLLHPFVAFGVMPLFALANSGVSVRGMTAEDLLAPVALGTALGLFVGKQIGIFAFTWAAVRGRLSPMPGGAPLSKLYGVSVVAGIGFTVALFIAGLAFRDAPQLLEQAKVGILLGSAAAGLAGFALLRMTRARAAAPAA